MTAVEAVRTHLNAAWPHAPHVLERAKIGRQRSDMLSEIGRLQQRIVQAQAVSLEDAAVQPCRLAALTEAENGAGLRSVLSSPDVCGLVVGLASEGAKGRLSCSRGRVLRGRPRRAMGRSPCKRFSHHRSGAFLREKIRAGVHFVSFHDGPRLGLSPAPTLLLRWSRGL